MEDNQIVLKVEAKEIAELGDKAKKLVFKPEFEEQLTKLLKYQKMVNDTVDMVRHEIQMSGDMLMPNFTGITGTTVKCKNQAYGAIYKFIDKSIVDPSFIKEFQTTRFNPDTKAIDDYKAGMGKLPEGIEENVRTKSLSVDLIEKK